MSGRAIGDGASLRLRAAWLYHNRGLTQKEIAENLGISRATVIRMLDEVLRRSEVQIWINEDTTTSVGLAIELENRFNLAEVVVVASTDNPTRAVGEALGQFLSVTLADGMTVGVGWGRTLRAALGHIAPQRREGMRVISLLGGMVTPGAANPVEFAWRLASLTGAGCHLFLSPLFVDSAETKDRLLRECGLGAILDLAGQLDVAVVSCGAPRLPGGSLAADNLSPEVLRTLLARGAVADVLCQFVDAQGQSVDHPLGQRLMAANLDLVASARHVVLATGGAERAEAISASIARFPGCTLLTDEAAARRLLQLQPAP